MNSYTSYYHLSMDKNLKELIPQIPKKLLIRKNAYEESTTKRISFAPTFEGCILGLQLSKNDFINDKLVLYVYEPININEKYLITNQEIVKKGLVFDAKITKECWYLKEVKVKPYGSITIFNEIIRTIEYKPIRIGNPIYLKPNGMLDTYLYKYQWSAK